MPKFIYYSYLVLIYFMFRINPSTQEKLCKPVIAKAKNSQLYMNGYMFIECEISSCQHVSKIVYKKSILKRPNTWTSVFEGVNKTYYHALDTGGEYSLDSRIDYIAFPTKHVLYIESLSNEDQGQWKCEVVSQFSAVTESAAVDVYYPFDKTITPHGSATNQSIKTKILTSQTPTVHAQVYNPSIRPTNPALVINQSSEFVCMVDGVHSPPDVIWKVNGKELTGGIAENYQHGNGLWFVMNTITLSFDKIGLNVLTCAMTTNTKDQWLQNPLSIDVKAPAKVLHPQEPVNITLGMSTIFALNCTGSGYRPTIEWTKDGTHITDTDERFIIKHLCNKATCTGSITPQPNDETVTCPDTEDYGGVYTCLIALEPPYKSIQHSIDIAVFIPELQCTEEYFDVLSGYGFTFTAMIATIVAGLAVLVLILSAIAMCIRKKRKKGISIYSEVSDSIPPPIGPRIPWDKIVEYEEIHDMIPQPISVIHTESSDVEHYSQCSVSDKESEHSYDVCVEGRGIQIPQQTQAITINSEYLHSCKYEEETHRKEDVVYKRMDSQGRATYITKEELMGETYLRMDTQIPTHEERNISENSCEYIKMANRASLKIKGAVCSNITAGQSTPTYMNNDAIEKTSKRKHRDIIIDQPDMDTTTHDTTSVC